MKHPFFVALVREVVSTFTDQSSRWIKTEETEGGPYSNPVLTLRCGGRTLRLVPNGELDMVWYETRRPTGDLADDGLPMMRIASSGVHNVEGLRALLEWVEGRPGDLLAGVLA